MNEINFSELPNEHKEFIVTNYMNVEPEDEFYIHYKGGLYWKMFEGKLTDDASDVIIYQHLYPHEQGYWVRNKAEFEDGRFRKIIND